MELVKASFLRRYKRFLVDVRMEDGREEVVHCANPGSMQGLLHVGGRVLLSRKDSGKLKYRLEYVTTQDGVLVGVNTARPNKVVKASILQGKIPCLIGYSLQRAEVQVGRSRLDFLLIESGRKFYLEVKNVTLSRQEAVAEFPDSPTARGAKHLDLLCELKKKGFGAGLMYVVQREDCKTLRLAQDVDSNYHLAAERARLAGVEFFCYSIQPFSDYVTKRMKYCP